MYYIWENPHQKRKTFIPENSYWREILVCLYCMLAGLQREVRGDYSSEDSYCTEASWMQDLWEIFCQEVTCSTASFNPGEKPIYELMVGRPSLTRQMGRHLRMLIRKGYRCSDCAKDSIQLSWQPGVSSTVHPSIHT